MRIFLSAGEPSGDLHGANLIRALQARQPNVECIGFGGDKMAAAGAELLYPLCRLSVMWFVRVLANAPVFLNLLSRTDRYFRHHRPDAVVLIDYPGFNWWVARRARFHGIPVFYFVPPQLWAWLGGRVRKMRRWVDHVLCSLPFEKEWYEARGVPAHYVGHPYFDELPRQRLDPAFLAQHQEGTVVGLLPGSRTQEVEANLPTLVQAAARIHQARPDTRFLVACFKAAHQAMVDAYLGRHPGIPITTHVARTPEIITRSRVCLAVSGSVSLELLWRAKPAVIVYHVGPLFDFLARRFKTVPYISLVNLLAGKELFPEYYSNHCAEEVAERALTWLNEPAAYQEITRELTVLKDQVAQSGACQRTAEFILHTLRCRQRRVA